MKATMMCSQMRTACPDLYSSCLSGFPHIHLIPSVSTCCTRASSQLSSSPDCIISWFISSFFLCWPCCCWCLFPLPGRGLASIETRLFLTQSQYQFQIWSQFQALIGVSEDSSRGSPLSRCAGVSGEGSRGSGRGRRCWAGTLGRWVRRWRGAWWVQRGQSAHLSHSTEVTKKHMQGQEMEEKKWEQDRS